MNEWPAAIWASVSAMTAALILSLILILGSMAREGANIIHQDENAVAIVKEFRRYLHLDGAKDLYSEDVITTIGESRGNPEIWVDSQTGSTTDFSVRWTKTSKPEEFTTTHLTEHLRDGGGHPVPHPTTLPALIPFFPPEARFDSELKKDANGAIIRIEFRRK